MGWTPARGENRPQRRKVRKKGCQEEVRAGLGPSVGRSQIGRMG